MKKNLIILAAFSVFLGGLYLYYQQVIVPQPENIRSLYFQIAEKKKQLLAAQILSEKRQGVNLLIQSNLIETPSDSLVDKASIPFLRYLTTTMDKLGIRLVSITPLDVVGTEENLFEENPDFIEVPYEMQIIASYKEFGEFLDILEKSAHLIRVSNFTVSNDPEQSTFANEISGKPRQHQISMEIGTLAILKASYRSESGEFN